jgi:hypothetical protein
MFIFKISDKNVFHCTVLQCIISNHTKIVNINGFTLYLPYGKIMELRFLPERGRRILKPERRSSRTFMRSGSVSIRTRRYESTLAVFRLTEVMEKAVFKEEKPTKPGDKNQKPCKDRTYYSLTQRT